MSEGLRTFHRWMAFVFTAVVAGIFITLGLGKEPVFWVYYLPLAPLALLWLTGAYMFVLPYFVKVRGGGAE
jgi:hypothetical protein